VLFKTTRVVSAHAYMTKRGNIIKALIRPA
jgi:hypothetical protein